MSNENVKGNKDSGAVVDINNDRQDYDSQYNSGKGGIVVMRGGKAELAGQMDAIKRGIPTKEELEAEQKEKDESMSVRVTMLPDELDPYSEEREIEITRSRTKEPKQITRIDIKSEIT